jgi:hypothetical protein
MTDFNFDYLDKLDISEKTARFTIYQIRSQPTFIVKHAGETNKPYQNATLRKASKADTRAIASGNISDEILNKFRKQDKQLYPKHVVVGWENVIDTTGKEVPFSVEACTAYIKRLPDNIFNELRTFASDPTNFYDDVIEVNEEFMGN